VDEVVVAVVAIVIVEAVMVFLPFITIVVETSVVAETIAMAIIENLAVVHVVPTIRVDHNETLVAAETNQVPFATIVVVEMVRPDATAAITTWTGRMVVAVIGCRGRDHGSGRFAEGGRHSGGGRFFDGGRGNNERRSFDGTGSGGRGGRSPFDGGRGGAGPFDAGQGGGSGGEPAFDGGAGDGGGGYDEEWPHQEGPYYKRPRYEEEWGTSRGGGRGRGYRGHPSPLVAARAGRGRGRHYPDYNEVKTKMASMTWVAGGSASKPEETTNTTSEPKTD
jgi:hypothetical protein